MDDDDIKDCDENDTLSGEGGDNKIDGKRGNDRIDGGAGDDKTKGDRGRGIIVPSLFIHTQ